MGSISRRVSRYPLTTSGRTVASAGLRRDVGVSAAPIGSSTTVAAVSANIALAAGANTIKFFNISAPSPATDRFGLVNVASCTPSPLDVILVMDRSGSVGGLPFSDAKPAARAFVDNLQMVSDRQAGVTSFSDVAKARSAGHARWHRGQIGQRRTGLSGSTMRRDVGAR